MPNSQTESQSPSQYPLTLAEVLFEEMELTWKEVEKCIDEDSQTQYPSSHEWTNLCTDRQRLRARVEDVGALQSYTLERIAEIFEREGIACDFAGLDESTKKWELKKALSSKIVPSLYYLSRKLHEDCPYLQNRRSALCLSGGGVRSAVFNLGILQGLARAGLLSRFDYLSTVSGGGFIGGWLSAWINRSDRDVTKVESWLSQQPGNPLVPEPKPVYNLRVFANYLTPRKGLLSPDTWTLIAVYLRNLFLNWLVFVPAIMTFLMLPRLWTGIVNTALRSASTYSQLPLVLGVIGLGCGIISLTCIMTNLPSVYDRNWRTVAIVVSCILPLLFMAICLSLYWTMVREHNSPTEGWISSLLAGNRPTWQVFVIAGAAIPGLPQLFVSLKSESKRRGKWLLLILGPAGGAISAVLTFALLQINPGPLVRLSHAVRFNSIVLDTNLLYVSLSIPFLLCVFMIGGTFVAGFSSRYTGSEDQEWWARSGAWLLIVVVIWALLSLLVTFGPLLLVDLRALFGQGKVGPVKSAITSLVGILSGVVSILGGKSSKTKANADAPNASWTDRLVPIIISIAAAIFALYIAVILVWLTDWTLYGVAKVLHLGFQIQNLPPKPLDHQIFVTHSPWWFEGMTTVVLFAVTSILGWLINTNRFSLHYYWRNRMMRAYLGATRNQDERDKTKNQFTGFDNEDNLAMDCLKQRPLHVVNATLNLAGGKKLEWQDRKAESFSISSMHSGSYWLGYRSSKEYGGEKGISLATSVAISGAAASPNMGYMMSSSIQRFIMTLFNVRMGFWLGNPGLAGKRTFRNDSPTQSVRPIAIEALGKTDDTSAYVYLSDGGHFDNFGLYEMILRRCRFIVVSDASTDPNYCYESLAGAIRQIRIDFGVPIVLRTALLAGARPEPVKVMGMRFGNDPEKRNKYCAVFDIRYSCVDKPDYEEDARAVNYDGVLIYIKPTLDGSEPADVLNYHKLDGAFPEDTIVDQWFSEPQFESYRMLGSHMVDKIRGDAARGSFREFEDNALRLFREQ